MRIAITGPDNEIVPDRTEIYNTLKRAEEDLLRRIPNLKEFVVDVHLLKSSPYGQRILVNHNLAPDETVLKLVVKYQAQNAANIKRQIAAELLRIKQIYY